MLWLQFTKCIHAQCGKIKRLLLFTWKIFGEKVVILYEWSDYKKRVLVKCNDDRLYLAEKISWNQYSSNLSCKTFLSRNIYYFFFVKSKNLYKDICRCPCRRFEDDFRKFTSSDMMRGKLWMIWLISINVCYRTHSSKHQISKNRGPPGGATISTHFLRAKH